MAETQDQPATNQIHLLKRSRGQIKAKLTRFKNFVAALQDDRSKLDQLYIRKQNIEDYYKEFDKIQANRL